MNDFFPRHKILPLNRSLEYRVKAWFTPIRKLIVHIKTERRCPISTPLATKLRAWNLGFTSMSYTLYQLDRNDPKDYLRDFSDINFKLNNPGAASVNDKFNFSRTMEFLGLDSPEIFLFMDRGGVLYSSRGATAENLEDLLTNLLMEHKRLVFKPAFRGAGSGIFFVENRGDKISINGIDAETSELFLFIEKQRYYLISEFVQQAPYAEEIYPGTANTVRLLTIWDRVKKTPVITAAAQRIGTERSYPVDNFHGGVGGLSASIDTDSGRLGPGVCLSDSGRLMHLGEHPETGGKIKGVVVPHWQEIKKKVMAAATHFAGSPYIGWDLLVTEKGCSFLEGNSPPGTMVWQVHAPLLANPLLRKFYREHHMLPP